MNETWWVDPRDLDDQQREILMTAPETEILIVGPPGSGKTNILMLRANYVRSVAPRTLFVTFTRTLTEFLRSGPNIGRADQIQRSEIMTFMAWARALIRDHGGSVPDDSGDFEQDRSNIAAIASELVISNNIGVLYDVTFIDEVQDFQEIELNVLRRVSARLNAAGDSRQRIWNHREGLPTVATMVDATVTLERHYRVGERICEFADQIAPPKVGEISLLEGCNYDEDARPSSVVTASGTSIDNVVATCMATIREQVRYITDEPIGVLTVANAVRDAFWEVLAEDEELRSIAVLQKQNDYQPFGPNSRIRVMSIASAKGSEFRAVHILDAERCTPSRRELAFTAVTRAKTEVALYHVKALPGHMTPTRNELPSLSSIF